MNKLIRKIPAQHTGKPDKWIDGEEAMHLLLISSKTTSQKLRDTDAIRFSQPMPKVVLYDSDAIFK